MPIDRSTPILIVSSTEGHLSMAKAIELGLRAQGFTSLNLFVENSAVLPYRLYYRYAPKLHRLADLLLGSMKPVLLLRRLLKLKYAKIAQTMVGKYQPKIVISTNYAFNSSFEPLHLKGTLQYFTVICDPRSYNLINVAHDGCVNLAFDEKQLGVLSRDFPKAICVATGWFVRPEFKPPLSSSEAKKTIGINPEKFCALFVAGSEGMQRVQNTVKVLAETKTDMTVLVACGKNQLLFKTIERLGQQYADSAMHIKPFGFTLEIAPYFQAADIIVGKAGPNMIFEAVACHKPFIATTSLEGQELGNLDLIKELNIGFTETDSNKAAKLLVSLVNNSDKITALTPNITELAEFNRESVSRLVQLLDKSITDY